MILKFNLTVYLEITSVSEQTNIQGRFTNAWIVKGEEMKTPGTLFLEGGKGLYDPHNLSFIKV